MIQLRLLGPLEVRVDGEQAPPELLWRKHAALLVYLALGGARARTRESLIALLWPASSGEAGRHSLNEAVRVIRRTAGAEAIVSGVGDVRLAPGAVESDVDALARLLAAGVPADGAGLIVGDLLDGFSVPDCAAFEQWLDAERRRWRRVMLEALLAASRGEAEAGHVAAALDLASRAVALDSMCEPATERVIEALALLGDRPGALDAYSALEAALGEVGAAPSRALRRRVDLIRSGKLTVTPPAHATGLQHERRLALMEREADLGTLLAAWRLGRNTSRSTLLVILGRDGCGRSRLASELAQRVRLDGTSVSFARTVPGDAALEGAGLVGLARGGLLDALGVAGATPEAIGVCAGLMPEWQERFPGVAPTSGSVGLAFAEVVRAAAGAGPILLVVDDAQWMDPGSRAALLAVLRDCAALPVTVALTLRPTDDCPDVDRARAHVGREWGGATVELAPLSLTAIIQLAADRFPAWSSESHERLGRRLQADSAGLPTLVGELLSAIGAGLGSETGSWPAPSRTLDATLPAGRPDAITAAVRVNYGCLTTDERELLAAASVLGERVTPEILRCATDRPDNDIARSLNRLEGQCWLESDARGYAFAARVVRDVIAKDFVTAGARRRLEQRLGRLPA